jgi:hypothetical protein
MDNREKIHQAKELLNGVSWFANFVGYSQRLALLEALRSEEGAGIADMVLRVAEQIKAVRARHAAGARGRFVRRWSRRAASPRSSPACRQGLPRLASDVSSRLPFGPLLFPTFSGVETVYGYRVPVNKKLLTVFHEWP